MEKTEEDARRVCHEFVQRGSGGGIQDQVDDEGSEDLHEAEDILSLEVRALDELVETRDPQVPREGQAEKGQRVDERVVLVVLSYVAH